MHLLAIALDRYWAVTRVDYIRCQRNERRILFMIFFVWMAACVISLAPVFGWKDAQFEYRITVEKECLISQDIGYQIFATCTTFYFPLTLTLIFYWKIYQVSGSSFSLSLSFHSRRPPSCEKLVASSVCAYLEAIDRVDCIIYSFGPLQLHSSQRSRAKVVPYLLHCLRRINIANLVSRRSLA